MTLYVSDMKLYRKKQRFLTNQVQENIWKNLLIELFLIARQTQNLYLPKRIFQFQGKSCTHKICSCPGRRIIFSLGEILLNLFFLTLYAQYIICRTLWSTTDFEVIVVLSRRNVTQLLLLLKANLLFNIHGTTYLSNEVKLSSYSCSEGK